MQPVTVAPVNPYTDLPAGVKLIEALRLLRLFVEHDDRILGDDPYYAMDMDDRAAIDQFIEACPHVSQT